MAKWLKNADIVNNTWVGQLIEPGEYYQIQLAEGSFFAENSALLSDIAIGLAVMASDNTGASDILDVNTAINFLKDLPNEIDANGNPVQHVAIREEFIPNGALLTGGRYQSSSIEIIADGGIGSESSTAVTFPYPISLFSAEWIHDANMDGDTVKIVAGENTVIGAITSDVTAGDAVISVQQSVVDNIRVGYILRLYDGVNQADLGRVITIDKDNLNLTVETPAANSFSAASPTYAQMTMEFIRRIYLKGSMSYALGKDIIGGSYLPANTPLKAIYKNNEGTNKTFSIVMEYKY